MPITLSKCGVSSLLGKKEITYCSSKGRLSRPLCYLSSCLNVLGKSCDPHKSSRYFYSETCRGTVGACLCDEFGLVRNFKRRHSLVDFQRAGWEFELF